MAYNIIDLRLNPPVQRSCIEKLERDLGILLPEEYVQFLLRHNGGSVSMYELAFDVKYKNGFVGKTIMSRFFTACSPEMSNDLLHTYRFYEEAERIPTSFLPIGYDFADSMVGTIVSGKNYGKMYYWDHEEETTEESELNYLADNLNLFLAGLKKYD
jgi:hypothetical protein